MLLTVNVTQQDIDDGNDTCRYCPIAIAATRALHDAGYSKEWYVEFEPYRAFCEPEGFAVRKGEHIVKTIFRLPVERCPIDAYEFASMFDDWIRDEEPEEDDDEPLECPGPFFFTISLRLPRKERPHA